ncbi:hypothetical protein TNCV_4057921 [Trichonephila clavipes]|nr:hypothetical protein TNCV_4057921 [Trichonephila clavipes]
MNECAPSQQHGAHSNTSSIKTSVCVVTSSGYTNSLRLPENEKNQRVRSGDRDGHKTRPICPIHELIWMRTATDLSNFDRRQVAMTRRLGTSICETERLVGYLQSFIVMV